MSNDNLRYWETLRRTDPKATKPFTRSGGFRGTQIDPVWRIQRMTQVFGPIGQGWGWEQVDWTVAERMVFICARVWYLHEGKQCWTGPQWGGTELVRRRRDGAESPDDEAFKMSMTDAVGKCLLQIGLAADVHMGLFEDSKYKHENEQYWREQRQQEAAAQKPAETTEVPEDTRAAAYRIKDAIDKSETLESLNAIMRAQSRTLEAIKAASQPAYESLMDRAEKRRMAFAGSPTQRMAS